MPRILWSILVALVCTVALAIPVVAQTPQASPVPVTMEGLVDGVSRQYSTDPHLVPADNPDELVIITVHLFRFDSEGHAAASWESLTANATAPLLTGVEVDDAAPGFEEEAIHDIGDRAHGVWLSSTNDADGVTGHFRLLYVQDGEYLILMTAIAGNEEASYLADDIARVMAEREAGTGEGTFDSEGGSTGGLWEKLPPADHDVIEELVPYRDTEIPA